MKTGLNSQLPPVERHPRKINWPLSVGVALVTFMILLTIFGPMFAPQDPMQENYALAVDGKIRTPPYPPLKVDGYPLGTDQFGRDLLSRILWGVRPTMIMVGTIAMVRLILGVILGLAAGWSVGRVGRFLDSLISLALSIPALIAAMVGIFIVGVDRGLIAFIVGLGITGWAESARMVSEQTRSIKSQTFVEAARALGASDRRILYKHVLRHILSLIWMLLSFEVSSALLVSAELGFLGYYIGGGVWVEILDFVVVHAEGQPELGQMISSALVKLTDPSALIIVGSVISTGVLGFNLLGEGLRLRMSSEWMQGGRRFRMLSAETETWLEERVIQPASFWLEEHRVALGWSLAVLVLVSGSLALYNSMLVRTLATADPGLSPAAADGQAPLWSGDRYDSIGSLSVPISLEQQPQLLWMVNVPGGPSGGPAVAADGTIYVAGLDKVLMALDPSGETLWTAALEEKPVGAPALDSQGWIFVADNRGGVTAVDPQGNILWRAPGTGGREATAGPILDAHGNIYLTVVDAVAALSPQGGLMWYTPAADIYLQEPPRLSSDQKRIYLKNTAIQAETGAPLDIPVRTPETVLFSDPTFFGGANGLDYYRARDEIIGWHFENGKLVTDEPVTWKNPDTLGILPFDQGVTRNGLAWLFYSTTWTDSEMIWMDAQSRLLGDFRFPRPNSRLIAIGAADEAYICGANLAIIECVNIKAGVEVPTWMIQLETSEIVAGGALIPGRFLISVTGDGLYVFGNENPQ